MAEEKRKGFEFPSAYPILFLLIVVVAIGTWFILLCLYALVLSISVLF